MLFVRLLCVAALVWAGLVSPLLAADNGLGRTPQMGWNSWNEYGCNINQSLIYTTIDQIIKLGLPEVGYVYVNLDDCWQSWRNAAGIIQADNETFPDGIPPLVQYAHANNLLFGLYSDAGTNTCQGRPGSLGYETNDANTYALWQVDYLKYDNCNNEGIPPKQRYPVMAAALNASGRHIFYSMCEWGVDHPALWAPELANSWRTTQDIKNAWASVMDNIDRNDVWWKYAGPGGWNDPDMLECPKPGQLGALTENEFVVEFTLWCIAKAPLIIGCDMSTLSDATLATLKNTELIAVNQDPLGVQGHAVVRNLTTGTDVWAGPLSNGRAVVATLNRGKSGARSIQVSYEDMGFPSTVTAVSLRDIINHVDVGVVPNPYIVDDVAPRSIRAFVATPVN